MEENNETGNYLKNYEALRCSVLEFKTFGTK